MPDPSQVSVDVAIIGGGPAGCTAASLLKKYNRDLSVLIIEREAFPRAHIGESQLPAIGSVLHEMGVWDKVEAADFPIKLGATFSWGRDREYWDFDFYPVEHFRDEPRPAPYEGQRLFTAFQVERAIYDHILLEHARGLGTEIFQPMAVREIVRDGDRVNGLRLADGRIVTARYYIDASGSSGFMRRALDVGSEAPVELRNIAIWDYWDNARWAVNIGVGGTRIQVRSLPYGWIWFIPLGPTRTSLGLVCPARYHAQRGISPEELYLESVQSCTDIAALVEGGRRRGQIETTKDWSHVSDRIAGENWFLVGEAAGFADPILSAGMTLAHSSAREAAYTILELDRGEHVPAWLRAQYDNKNRKSIWQHIRFAQYWYASNGCFTELKAHCRDIAREAGFRMTPESAWAWLARGGFSNQMTGLVMFGSFDLFSTHMLVERFQGTGLQFQFQKYNVFRLNLLGAAKDTVADLHEGRIQSVECWRRGDRVLPNAGAYRGVIEVLKEENDGQAIMRRIFARIDPSLSEDNRHRVLSDHMQALEAMLLEGWISAKHDKRMPDIRLKDKGSGYIRATSAGEAALRARSA
jgi:flavin-dependent dehydrogenase